MAPIPAEEYCVRMGQDARTGGFWRDAFAELLATFLLVAVQIILLQAWGSTDLGAWAIKVAFGMALVVAAVGYGLGDYGGAHMNPAITLAMMVRSEISFFKGLIYWVVQGGGAIGAAFFVAVITPDAERGNLGNTELAPGLEPWQAVIIEGFVTLILCLTALASQNIARKGYVILPSIPIGFALGLGLFLSLPSTGGSLNPARSLGPAVAAQVMMGVSVWETHWVYWAGPMGGALLAAIFYWIFDSVDKPPTPVYDNTNTWAYNKSQSKEALNDGPIGRY